MVKSARPPSAKELMTLSKTLTTRIAYLRDAYPVSPLVLSIATLVFVFYIDNDTFWSIGSDVFAGHPLSFGAYILAVFTLMLSFFSVFAFPWVVKPFLAFIVILSAITSYYMDNLGVIIDRDMIQNVMVTTVTESKHLITASFVLHNLVFGVLPVLVIFAVKIKPHGRTRTLLTPVVSTLLCLGLTVGLLWSDMKAYASILRERKDFMSSFQPGMPIVGAIRYAKMMRRSANVTVAKSGEDAVKGPAYGPDAKPVLTIVVAGETARAQNFSLNGYGVETNPELAKLPVVSFTDVSSCGTATAVSLPCMFSKFTRSTYSFENGIATESVLDVMAHAGFHVEWWDNNTGDKAIASRLTKRSLTNTPNTEFCAAGECMDGIFLKEVEDFADAITQDTVLVLHQIGSHGPTYYLRYPETFEKFKPSCRTAEFKSCTPQEIANAYDNTIAYTDKVLADIIRVLQSRDALATAMIYMSDHGESLGEGGMYLHGAPYFMAPDTQTKVPAILWMSQNFEDQLGIDRRCMAAKAGDALSHDNLFHSLLGMLDIQTAERDNALDIFATCKNATKGLSN